MQIRRALETEWKQVRRLRLEMLGDAPASFNDRLANVEQWDDQRWLTRIASALMPDSLLLVAATDAGDWVGQMAAREFHEHGRLKAWLLEVYVTPEHRSSGLADRLLAGVQEWARDRGHQQLHLDVHEHAAAARRFYARHGFIETGNQHPYSLDPSKREIEMVCTLTP